MDKVLLKKPQIVAICSVYLSSFISTTKNTYTLPLILPLRSSYHKELWYFPNSFKKWRKKQTFFYTFECKRSQDATKMQLLFLDKCDCFSVNRKKLVVMCWEWSTQKLTSIQLKRTKSMAALLRTNPKMPIQRQHVKCCHFIQGCAWLCSYHSLMFKLSTLLPLLATSSIE